MSEIREAIQAFVQSGKNGSFLITSLKNGRPYAVQITTIVDDDFTIRIRTNRETVKAGQVRRNGSVGVLFVERAEGIQKNVLIQGDAVIADDPASVDAFFDEFPKRFGMNIDRTLPRFATSVIVTIRPVFLRAEGFTGERRETHIERFG